MTTVSHRSDLGLAAGVLLLSGLLGCAAPGGRHGTDPAAAEGGSTQEVSTGAFSSVAADGTFDVEITVGFAHRVTVLGDQAALRMASAEVRDGVLHLRYLPTAVAQAGRPVRFEVTMPALHALQAHVVTNISVAGVEGTDLFVAADGASTVELDGKVRSLRAQLHRQADLDARRLAATNVDVTVHGGGHAEVHARQSLRAAVYGLGEVRYHGQPQSIDVPRGRARVEPARP